MKKQKQYQSFPQVSGDSKSFEKLKYLRIPSMNEKSFLDVGCNEGFFCGYALWDGAKNVTGIDQDAEFIARARLKFPASNFLNQKWDKLPNEKFDVILLASALHYATDQEALIVDLVKHLTPNGILILELGIHPDGTNQWIEVVRGIDKRFFPTIVKFRNLLAKYEFSYVEIGKSVDQPGDPTPRFVYHIKKRKNMAYLLMQPPSYGKTSIARNVFEKAGYAVLSGDRLLHNLLESENNFGNKTLFEEITKRFGSTNLHLNLGEIYKYIFNHGYGENLIEQFFNGVNSEDFVFDGYIPEDYHQLVLDKVIKLGFLPVKLDWAHPGQIPPELSDTKSKVEKFKQFLLEDLVLEPTKIKTRGHIDTLDYIDNVLTVTGWAVNTLGNIPSSMICTIKGKQYSINKFKVIDRSDVGKNFNLDNKNLGFYFSILSDEFADLNKISSDFSIHIDNEIDGLSKPFSLGKAARRHLPR